ncbi:predicted protein [Lichtheimia corymbifera JMRC:FSU:9682]|uniref:Uncharacterized protein n=1 Tax=Lichtheimia corymbifera JMRC:FSU:9682 TaxID=1263082 RepID=A0A068SAL3_9FUNG|nr:predicted protein [Lichtheimia corymbifera JMRC:FSU:9682]
MDKAIRHTSSCFFFHSINRNRGPRSRYSPRPLQHTVKGESHRRHCVKRFNPPQATCRSSIAVLLFDCTMVCHDRE